MAAWQKIALAIVLVLMVVSILVTWGSIFSIVMTLGLLYAGGVLLYQKFILNGREDNDYWGDQNG